jgi:hypothetical protein
VETLNYPFLVLVNEIIREGNKMQQSLMSLLLLSDVFGRDGYSER